MKAVPFVAHKPVSRPYPYGLLIKRVPFRAKLGKDGKWRIYPGLRLGAKRHWLTIIFDADWMGTMWLFPSGLFLETNFIMGDCDGDSTRSSCIGSSIG